MGVRQRTIVKVWGCETTGHAYWNPSSTWDFITVKRGNTPGYTYGGRGKWKCTKDGRRVDCGPCYDSLKTSHIGATPGGRCNPLVITFTEAGKKANWDGPKSWGLRLYRTGHDPVTIFSISRSYTNISSHSQSSGYLVPPEGTYWACSAGLNPCVSLATLNFTSVFCVMVTLWPRIIYHPISHVVEAYENAGLRRLKRNPASITLAVLLGGLATGGIAAGIGTGVVALNNIHQLKILQQGMHEDIKEIEKSITNLETSLSSLEVCRPKRRMLFLGR